MKQWNPGYTGNGKDVTPFDLKQFADHIQEQANCMDKSGWCDEARNLRKWATELRDKLRASTNRLDGPYVWDR